ALNHYYSWYSGSDRLWFSLFQQSIQLNTLSRVTSFVVLENQAQEIMLKKKQEQVLSAKKTLDASDEIIEMSEPHLFFLLILFLLFILVKKTGLLVNKKGD
ncbi:MAG: hypothetical protein MJB14_21855, partial [Spirochaetes bacterium]|nr:hypothetical protein [Spirochaetota bacterium]